MCLCMHVCSNDVKNRVEMARGGGSEEEGDTWTETGAGTAS